MRWKTNAETIIQRFKARICARGDMIEGIHLVAKWGSIRLRLTLTVLLSLIPLQLVVDLAYLYASLTEIITIPPPGIDTPHGNGIKNSAISIRTSSRRNWNIHLNATLQKAGFTRFNEDTCLHIMKIGVEICIIAIYVDDLYISYITNDTKTLVDFITTIYKIKVIGILQQLLGVKYLEIRSPTAWAYRHVTKYVQTCYINLVCSYFWILQAYKLDICYTTMMLCRLSSNSDEAHWRVATTNSAIPTQHCNIRSTIKPRRKQNMVTVRLTPALTKIQGEGSHQLFVCWL